MRLTSHQHRIGFIDFLAKRKVSANICAKCLIIGAGILFAFLLKYGYLEGAASSSDKKVHFWIGQMVAVSVFFSIILPTIARIYFTQKSWESIKIIFVWLPAILAVAMCTSIFFTLLLAAGKEVVDIYGAGTPDILDLKYTFEGGISLVIPISFFVVLPFVFITENMLGKLSRFPKVKIVNSKKKSGHRIGVQDGDFVDRITNMANRRCFDVFYENAWQCARRDNQPIAVIVVGLDLPNDYKNKNGRKKSVECLKLVSAVLKEFGNQGKDLVARFDRSEFIFLLIGLEKNDLYHTAHKLHKNIKLLKNKYPFSENSKGITFSMGISIFKPDDDNSPQMLLELANNALNKARRKGGNVLRFLQPL